MPGHSRAQVIYYIAENLIARTEEFAKRIIAHMNPEIDSYGTRAADKVIKAHSDNSVVLYGIHMSFYVNNNEAESNFPNPWDKQPIKSTGKPKGIEIIVEKTSDSDFLERVEAVLTKDFWKDSCLVHLKKNKRKYSGIIKNLFGEVNGEGNYHFFMDLNTNSDDKAFFSVLNIVIKPVCCSFFKQ